MSGRPHGPYTVKNLNPTQLILNNFEYVYEIISLDSFVAPYKEIGLMFTSLSFKIFDLLSPYTELDEAKIKNLVLYFFDNSITLKKPLIFTSIYFFGFIKE